MGGSGSRFSDAFCPCPFATRATGKRLNGFGIVSGIPNSTLAKLMTADRIDNSRDTVAALTLPPAPRPVAFTRSSM
ncbi:hypothetical protein AP073_14785 [Rhodobacter capsulatus]|nr:hypothetical protein AP073_14785 [Rhodobacter capsulatus]